MIEIPEGYSEGVGVILQRGKRLLLHLRDDDKADVKNAGLWGFIAGGLNEHEKPVDAAVRELREELGLKFLPTDLRYFLTLDLPKIFERHHIFVADFPYSNSEIKLTEGQGVRDFSYSEIERLENIVPGVPEVLRIWRLYS